MGTQIAPTTSSMCLHWVHRIKAEATPDNGGAFYLKFSDAAGWETFSLVTFTENGDMAIELAAALNAVLAKHGRLLGQPERATLAEAAA